ncbi:cytochrome b562 family protein [Vibrio ostreicida]|nr:cytochrome b562 family protein [Vibrio ostreicida]
MKTLLPAVALMLSVQTFAASFDLKSTMKQMKMEFNQAAQATEISDMQEAVTHLSDLIEQAKRGDYPPEKWETYLEGFNKLSLALDTVEKQLDAGDLTAAKASLRQVDELRIEYHDKRNPSIWSKLFG